MLEKLVHWKVKFLFGLLSFTPLAHASPVANSYFNIALILSKDVNAGNGSCAVYSTALEILDAVQKAKAHNDELVGRVKSAPEIQKAVGKYLTFKVLVDGLNINNLKVLSASLPGTSFHGPERGNYGPEKTITFLPQGALKIESLVEGGPNYKKVSEIGTWKLISDGKIPATISIQISAGGKTVSYSLKEMNVRNGPIELGLVTNGSNNTLDALTEIPSDCP